jgi:hypothetical protein
MGPQWSLEDEAEQLPRPLRRMTRMRWIALGVSTAIGVTIVLVCLHFIGDTPEKLVFKTPDHELTGLLSIYDSRLGWRNVPNYRGTTYGKPVTINSNGLRDRDYAYAKPAGTQRILVLGDSYVWGYGVADDEIFVKVLERRLQESGLRWETINTGVTGWGTDQEVLFLANEGFRYAPDIVVVAMFLGNDPENILYSKQYGLDKPVFMDAKLTLANSPVPTPRQDRPLLTTQAAPLSLMVAILTRMAQSCREHDCRLVVMKFGLFLPEFQNMVGFDRDLASRAAAIPNLYYLDLDKAFAQRQLTAQRLLEGNHDGHWNALGHQEVAAVLQQALRSFGLLGDRSEVRPAAKGDRRDFP